MTHLRCQDVLCESEQENITSLSLTDVFFVFFWNSKLWKLNSVEKNSYPFIYYCYNDLIDISIFNFFLNFYNECYSKRLIFQLQFPLGSAFDLVRR